MKKYQPKTNHYRELLVACGQELRTLGYATNTAKLCGTGEFLQRMEMVGKLRLDQVEREDIKAHHEHLLARPQVQTKGLMSRECLFTTNEPCSS